MRKLLPIAKQRHQLFTSGSQFAANACPIVSSRSAPRWSASNNTVKLQYSTTATGQQQQLYNNNEKPSRGNYAKVRRLKN